jgi:hypothetical protein
MKAKLNYSALREFMAPAKPPKNLPGWPATPTSFLPLTALSAVARDLREGCSPLPELASV